MTIPESDPIPETDQAEVPKERRQKVLSGQKKRGRLYLIPTPLGPSSDNQVLPAHVIDVIHRLDTFFVERIRSANSFLRWIRHPLPDFKCRFYELNKHTPGEDLIEMLTLLKQGTHAGIISEAGCPAVADPGSSLVRLAHETNIPVTPLVGPSSILLAVMASGLNGQSFTFHGYLPKPGKQRTERIRKLQADSAGSAATQVFMETPFRNNDLLNELIRELHDETLLCAASSLTLPEEQIITKKISDWKRSPVDLDHLPAIFLLLASGSGDAGGTGFIPGKKTAGTHKNGRKKKPAHKRKRAR